MESIVFTCNFIIANFHVLGLFIQKIRLSNGVVALQALHENCNDDISAVLRATDLRFRLLFWEIGAGWIQILKSQILVKDAFWNVLFDFFCSELENFENLLRKS
jgi:hypothetical protein